MNPQETERTQTHIINYWRVMTYNILRMKAYLKSIKLILRKIKSYLIVEREYNDLATEAETLTISSVRWLRQHHHRVS